MLTWFGKRWDRWLGSGWGPLDARGVTMYKFDTAMHGAINVRTRWGFVCFAWPRLGLKRTSFGAYFYLSPNATPWAATFMVGGRGDWSRDDRRMARVRRALWGHGYDCNRLDPQVLDQAVAVVECNDRIGNVRTLERMVAERDKWVA